MIHLRKENGKLTNGANGQPDPEIGELHERYSRSIDLGFHHFKPPFFFRNISKPCFLIQLVFTWFHLLPRSKASNVKVLAQNTETSMDFVGHKAPQGAQDTRHVVTASALMAAGAKWTTWMGFHRMLGH